MNIEKVAIFPNRLDQVSVSPILESDKKVVVKDEWPKMKK